ncbi:MAG: hypothetical protein L0G99_15520 [Propionibacteriales bacterium]|nr:hypothetical protein [Propionibacteriales bacterium]
MSESSFAVDRTALRAGYQRFMERAEDVNKLRDYWNLYATDLADAQGGLLAQMNESVEQLTPKIHQTFAVMRAEQSTIAENFLDSQLAYERTEQENIGESRRIWNERTQSSAQESGTSLRSQGHLVDLPSTKLRPPEPKLEPSWQLTEQIVHMKLPGVPSQWDLIKRFTGFDVEKFFDDFIGLFVGNWRTIALLGDVASNLDTATASCEASTRNDAGVFIEDWTGGGAQLARNHCDKTADRLGPVADGFQQLSEAYKAAAALSSFVIIEIKTELDNLLGIVGLLVQLVVDAVEMATTPDGLAKWQLMLTDLTLKYVTATIKVLELAARIWRAFALLLTAAGAVAITMRRYQAMEG